MVIERRQDRLRNMSSAFASKPTPGTIRYFSMTDVARVRASYAYHYDWTQKSSPTRFPWDVAMRDLGLIKSQAHGSFKACTSAFYDKFSMRSSVLG